MKIVERRSAQRVSVSVPIHQFVEGQTHRCLASNLSLSGVYIERPIASFVRHSTAVELEIPLPDGETVPLRTAAEIVYDCFDAALHGSALRFTEMSGRDRARLSAFLERGERGPDPSNAQAA
jgi:c-di-GMP-binding flagellar brake protein YcgR